jgi:hypothetical protein
MQISGQFNDAMTLEEKLAILDRALANAQTQADARAAEQGRPPAPIDPAELTMCDGCK